MLFDMRGETVPKAAAISMVNRTLKDDGHSPSARECVEIVDTLAAADGNDRVLNFTALEFWTVADRVMYPRACECEGEREDRLSEDDDPVLFNLCRMIDTFQRVLYGEGDSTFRALSNLAGMAAMELAKDSLPDGAMDAYESTKAAR